MPKLYFGSRGGTYYKKKGKKVYVKNNNFGVMKIPPNKEKRIRSAISFFNTLNPGWQHELYGGQEHPYLTTLQNALDSFAFYMANTNKINNILKRIENNMKAEAGFGYY